MKRDQTLRLYILGWEGPNQKIPKPRNKPWPSAFRQKKDLGQFDFAMGGKLQFRGGGMRQSATKWHQTLSLHILG